MSSSNITFKCGGQGRNRTADTSLFRALLTELGYVARETLNANKLLFICHFFYGILNHKQESPSRY